MDLHSTVQGWIGYVKKLLVSQYFFNVLASKVKNPKWPEANHLNGYIYKQGHSLDFSKGMHKLFSPSSPTHLKTPNHFKVSYIWFKIIPPMNLFTSLETDIRVWKKHSVKLFFFLNHYLLWISLVTHFFITSISFDFFLSTF